MNNDHDYLFDLLNATRDAEMANFREASRQRERASAWKWTAITFIAFSLFAATLGVVREWRLGEDLARCEAQSATPKDTP